MDPMRPVSPPAPPPTPPLAPARRKRGFTLIEIIAVVAIFAMIFALGVPRLSSSKWRALRDEGESIAASLEFARQRAIMTGVPHRVLIDLEQSGYRIEWWVSEDEAFGALGGDEDSGFATAFFGSLSGGDDEGDFGPNTPLDLYPPLHDERDYHPIPNRQLGSFTWLSESLYFVGLDGASGWIESGDVHVVFDADGTTEYALLEIADADDHHLTLEIEPILDRVRRREGRARS